MAQQQPVKMLRLFFVRSMAQQQPDGGTGGVRRTRIKFTPEKDAALIRFVAEQQPDGGTGGVRRTRIKFTPEKDAALIRFVAEHGRHQDLKPTAPKFWEVKAPLLPPLLAVHSPLSIHTHFIKQVSLAVCQGSV